MHGDVVPKWLPEQHRRSSIESSAVELVTMERASSGLGGTLVMLRPGEGSDTCHRTVAITESKHMALFDS